MKMKTTSFIRYSSKMWVFVTLGLRVTHACSHFATLLYISMQPFFVYTRPVTSLFRCILIHNKVNLTSLYEFFISVKPRTEYSEKFSVIVICKSLIHNPVARCRIYWFFFIKAALQPDYFVQKKTGNVMTDLTCSKLLMRGSRIFFPRGSEGNLSLPAGSWHIFGNFVM